jgi:glycosyltransferase involved in cell wall biosynthesis
MLCIEPYSLLIEGWRFIPHSYAIVNQFQCHEMLQMPCLRLFHRDMPYHHSRWQAVSGLFSPEAEAAIRSIPSIGDNVEADTLLRITFPYNLAPSKYKRTCVFGTSEFKCIRKDQIVQNRPLKEVMAESEIIIITPSHWSRDGFIESGGDPKRIVVIPHGVDPAIFYPLEEVERETQRTKLDFKGFTFLTIGTMLWNKGLKLLLKAFAEVSYKYPHVQLVMKGIDALYPSQGSLLHQTKDLTMAEIYRVQERLRYIGQTLNFQEIARLYQAADVYISPYLAEGFNMPCLEAAACGTVVICTKGGATDDFTHPDFTLHIQSTAQACQIDERTVGTMLQPNYEHLVHQMIMAIEHPDLCSQVRIAGPKFVSGQFTWKHIVEKLLRVLF